MHVTEVPERKESVGLKKGSEELITRKFPNLAKGLHQQIRKAKQTHSILRPDFMPGDTVTKRLDFMHKDKNALTAAGQRGGTAEGNRGAKGGRFRSGDQGRQETTCF